MTGQVSHWDVAKRALIMVGSLLLSCWLVVQLVAVGMFDFPKGETAGAFWLRIMGQALGGGIVAGLAWGRSSLKRIAYVLVPGGIFLGLVSVTLPISMLGMFFDSSDAGLASDLFMTAALLLLLAGVTFFPLLGPFISHALWNRLSRAEMRAELGTVWGDVKAWFRSKW